MLWMRKFFVVQVKTHMKNEDHTLISSWIFSFSIGIKQEVLIGIPFMTS